MSWPHQVNTREKAKGGLLSNSASAVKSDMKTGKIEAFAQIALLNDCILVI